MNLMGIKDIKIKRNLKIILVLLMWILIFDPPLVASFNCLHILGAIGFVYALFNRRIEWTYIKLMLLSILIFIYILFHLLFYSNAQIISYPLFLFIDVIPVCYMINNICHKNGVTHFEFVDLIIFAGLIAAFITFISLLSPDIKEFFFNQMIQYTGDEAFFRQYYGRIFGFYSNSLYSAPIALSLVALLCIERYARRGKKTDIFISIFIVVMAFFNARISAAIYFFGILAFAYSHKKSRKKVLLCCGIFVVLLIIGWSVLKSLIHNSSGYNHTLYWLYDGLAQIFSVFDSDIVVYHSTTGYYVSAQYWQLPSNGFALLFGYGQTILNSSIDGVSSDIGFINDVWFGGIFYTIILYITTFFSLTKIYLRKKVEYGEYMLFYYLLCIGTLLISNLKGIAFGFNCFIVLIILMTTNLMGERMSGSYE